MGFKSGKWSAGGAVVMLMLLGGDRGWMTPEGGREGGREGFLSRGIRSPDCCSKKVDGGIR